MNLDLKPVSIRTKCPDCGVELLRKEDGYVTISEHPNGPCPLMCVLGINEDRLTLEEFRALIRVARMQMESEKRRGIRQ